MEMAFMQEGGMKDDGMNIDPVSGNEIPPGSMAKEVRDDIPAMLSEGEYVVPADVVQYFGVKFFEDIRMTAKMGLQKMQRDGRIGGEPIDDNEEELDPNENAVLLEVMQMNTGGVVGYNTGGLEGQQLRDYTLQPTPMSYLTPGAFQLQAAGMGTPPQVDTGEPQCPPGHVFDKEKNMCVPVATTQSESVMPQESKDSPTEPLEPATPWHEQMDWENPVEYYADMFKPKSNMQKAIPAAIASTVGGPIGAVMAAMAPVSVVRNIAEMRATAMVYRAAGNTELADQLLEQSNAYVKAGSAFVRGLDAMVDSDGSMIFSSLSKSMGGPNIDALIKSGEIDDINVYLDSLSGAEKSKFQRYLANKGYGKKQSKTSGSGISSEEETQRKQTATNLIAQNKRSSEEKDRDNRQANITASQKQAASGTSSSKAKAIVKAKDKGVSTKTAAKLSGAQMKAGADVGSGVGGTNLSGPFNKGGLMKKR